MRLLWGFLSLFIACSAEITQQKPLVIITASYNNSQWCKKYLDSIAQQTYQNWFLIYINDNSTDDTLECITSLIYEYHLEDKVLILNNSERKGHLYNQYHAIHSVDSDKIIVIVDGDDWLAHENVFATINTIYQDPDIWLTYGQFWYLKKNKKGFCKPIPKEVTQNNGIRDITWRTSHLRTFYAGLFQSISYDDLLHEGNFFPKCADVVTMFAMIEMAAFHVKFIPEILYIYNDDNPLSYHHDPTHQRELEECIRKKRRYEPLKEKTW